MLLRNMPDVRRGNRPKSQQGQIRVPIWRFYNVGTVLSVFRGAAPHYTLVRDDVQHSVGSVPHR